MSEGKPKRKPNKGSFTKENPGPGRPAGIPNKATTQAREAIARFIDCNTDRLQSWLDEIYEQDGPKAAFGCFSDMLEYYVPKLQRTEHVGDGGGPVVIRATKEDEDI